MNNLYKLSIQALRDEVLLDYKPGLVCLNSNGSHTDMNIETFYKSIEGLKPHFRNYEMIGSSHSGTLFELFEKLRVEGIKAEQSMFMATQGINTHKGANFIHSILIGALAYLIKEQMDINLLPDIIKKMCQHLANDFNHIESSGAKTHGEQIYLQTKQMGIRQEAMDGFPILFEYPFSKLTDNELSEYHFLLGSMSVLMDTTIIHRAGLEGLKWTQAYAKQLSPNDLLNRFDEINNEFVRRNISPGGSADFLSAAIFLKYVRKKGNLRKEHYGNYSNI